MAADDSADKNRPHFEYLDHVLNSMVFETFGDQRYTQDSPIMPEVWIAYARAPRKALDVILTPRSGDSPSQLASRVAERLAEFRKAEFKDLTHEKCLDCIWAEHNIAYSRSSIVVKVTFRELICVIVPTTVWWSALSKTEALKYSTLSPRLEEMAAENKSLSEIIVDASRIMKRPAWDFIRFCALAGLIELAAEFEGKIEKAETDAMAAETADRKRSKKTAAARGANPEKSPGQLTAEYEAKLKELMGLLNDRKTQIAKITEVIDAYGRIEIYVTADKEPPLLQIFMITENREAHLSITASRATVKADAANNVFDIDTKDIAWAVIDGGIDARHPAFLDRKATQELLAATKLAAAEKAAPQSNPESETTGSGNENPSAQADGTAAANSESEPAPITDEIWSADIPIDRMSKLSRVRETYDFTYLRQLLATKTLPPEEKGGPSKAIADYIREHHQTELEDLVKRTGKKREIDWDIVAPLIRVPHDKNYVRPTIPHGTHVAGILGADWLAKDNPENADLVGICPQIRLYDLRVFKPDIENNEFTVQYALQFVEHLNRNREIPRVHGVNLSLSMLHKVMSFGCGRTPVCDECNDLVGAGLVVVVAAGNDGYKTFKTDKGDYSGYHTASITDPGNAADVITVGSTHRSHPHSYGVSYFSSRGPTGDGRRKPDLVAPGEKITAPVLNCGVQRMDGTSMAAPHVSGAAALLMARHRELIGDPRRIKEILCGTATDLGREPQFQGAGMIDILRALQSI